MPPPQDIGDIRAQHAALVSTVRAKDYKKGAQILAQLKLTLLGCNILIPNVSAAPQALCLARDVLETGAVVSINLRDEGAFLRYYAQLQPFYAMAALEAAPSKNKNKIMGLYLLLLLTKNNIADFHTTLENMPGLEEDVFVRYPVMLERWLMEGSYDKVWQATKSSHVPSDEYAMFSEVGFLSFMIGGDGGWLMDVWEQQVLVGTIRSEIASCSEKAYTSLPVSNAKQLLFLESEGAVVKFAVEVLCPITTTTRIRCHWLTSTGKQRGWEVRDGRIYFPVEESEKEAMSSNKIIENTIGYAQELETIV